MRQHQPTVEVRRALRATAVLLVAAGISAISNVAQATDAFAGEWNAAIAVNGQRCLIDTVMDGNGSYQEVVSCGQLKTYQSGTYLYQGGLLVRQVEDWEPKQSYSVDVCHDDWKYPGKPGCHHSQPTTQPPGGSYRVSFRLDGSMQWRDVNFGGTTSLYRVR